LKKSLIEKKLAVDISKKEKDTLLIETKNKESNYKKLLADRIKKRDAFEKDLENYEAQLKFILNPNLLPTEGSGILSWPLDNVFVTQLFGKTISAKIVSNAKDDFPEPESPVKTTILLRGISTVIFLRL
jgi:hypothetical protein